jgi:hypothetical protein
MNESGGQPGTRGAPDPGDRPRPRHGRAPEPDEPTTQRLTVLEKTPPGGTPMPSATAYNPIGAPGSTGRFWSRRRVPAGVVALLVLAGSGLLLYDIVAVRAGRSAMQWRRSLAGELATRSLDDTAVLAGAAACAALGLWLLLLAATPGLRRLLPMRQTHAEVRGALHRGAVTLVLRDRAIQVPGVQSAGVHTTRHRVRVRALTHFRELDDVRTDLHTALAEGIRDLGLVHPPSLTVRVARAGRRGSPRASSSERGGG